jgi:hypothetical protein
MDRARTAILFSDSLTSTTASRAATNLSYDPLGRLHQVTSGGTTTDWLWGSVDPAHLVRQGWPWAFQGGLGQVTDVDEAGHGLTLTEVEQELCPGVIGIPVGDPAGGEAQGIGGVFKVHANGPGG